MDLHFLQGRIIDRYQTRDCILFLHLFTNYGANIYFDS